MSEWYEASDDDIEIDEKLYEVNLLVKQNDFGNVYVTLTFHQVMAINEQIHELLGVSPFSESLEVTKAMETAKKLINDDKQEEEL